MDLGVEPQSGLNLDPGGVKIDFGPIMDLAIWLAVVIAIFWLARKIIKYIARKHNYYDHVIYQVRLPKEKPGDDNKSSNYLQSLREEIARGETLFASIGGLRPQHGFKAWLLGRSDHFSFEIVANKKLITFYIVSQREMGRYIEQQVQAYYPEAVMEEVEDYNIFTARGQVAAGFLKTQRHFIFPIKTYNKKEADPLDSIINVMSKLDVDEGMALQIVARSAKGSWHRKASEVVSRVHQGKKISEVMGTNALSKILGFVGDIFSTLKPEDKKDPYKDQNKIHKLTAMEEEMLKGIEEKNSKAGLDVNIRVIVSARDLGRAHLYLNNMVSTFSEYNYYQYGNSFNNRQKVANFIPLNLMTQEKLIKDFIYRHYNKRIRSLLNTEELNSIFHFPLQHTETPNILWLTAKHAPAPNNIPDDGIILGRNIFRGMSKDIRISRADRRRHMYMIGKSGVGKSFLMSSLVIQDIINGEGVCVIDPHGDLIKDIMERIPPERAEDVILFAPADNERPLALNLMEFDPRYPDQKTFVINEMIKIFDKLYDLKATGGPIFEQYMRNAMLLVMSDPDSGSTLMEIPKVLSDPEFRRMKLDRCKDPTVVDFWRKEAEKAGGDAALANIVPYVTSKLTSFISNDTMRPIIGQQNSSFNVRDVMDKRKILLVDLTKGLIGEMNAFLLGMIIVGKVLMAALSRADMSGGDRKDFYLYVDEFQNFTTDSVASILSEARKYNLNLIIAHQYINQLVQKGNDTSIKDAVFGNVGTWVLFKIGTEDAEVMEKEMSPVFNKFDLINIEKHTAYCKLLIDNTASRPFSMSTIYPLPGVERPDMAAKIKTLSRLKYGQDRNIIEAEIMRRARSI